MEENFFVPVNCRVVLLDISGVVTHYNEKKWIDDPNEDEGGTFQEVRKKYEVPRLNLKFIGVVNIKLKPGSIYIDGINTFRAMDEFTIMNVNVPTVFSLPKQLACTGDPFPK